MMVVYLGICVNVQEVISVIGMMVVYLGVQGEVRSILKA